MIRNKSMPLPSSRSVIRITLPIASNKVRGDNRASTQSSRDWLAPNCVTHPTFESKTPVKISKGNPVCDVDSHEISLAKCLGCLYNKRAKLFKECRDLTRATEWVTNGCRWIPTCTIQVQPPRPSLFDHRPSL